MNRIGSEDQSFREFIEACCQGEQMEKRRRMAISYVQGFDAAKTEKISVKALIHENEAGEAIEGDRQFRIVNGYDSVVDWLRAGFDPERVEVHLNTIVKAVRWEK